MRYEWDDAKNRRNRDKHGLDFADQHLVLDGRCVTFVDDSCRVWRDTACQSWDACRAGGGDHPYTAWAGRDAHHLHEKGEPP